MINLHQSEINLEASKFLGYFFLLSPNPQNQNLKIKILVEFGSLGII